MNAGYNLFHAIKLVHLAAIFALFLAFGVVLGAEEHKRWHSLLHGIALFVIIASGFSMLHVLGIHGVLPGWVLGKITIWLLLGIALIPSKRKLLPRSVILTLLVLLGAGAGFLALWKPGWPA